MPLPVSTQKSRKTFTRDRIDWADLPEDDGVTLDFRFVPGRGVIYEGSTRTQHRPFWISHPIDLIRLTQGAQGASWFGNFTDGDALLFTGGDRPLNAAPVRESLVLNFDTPITGAAVQFQARLMSWNASLDFVAHMVLVGESPNQFADVSAPGRSSNACDGSAVLLAAKASSAKVRRIELYVTDVSGIPLDFAINRLDIA